jgi:hypothetical protein
MNLMERSTSAEICLGDLKLAITQPVAGLVQHMPETKQQANSETLSLTPNLTRDLNGQLKLTEDLLTTRLELGHLAQAAILALGVLQRLVRWKLLAVGGLANLRVVVQTRVRTARVLNRDLQLRNQEDLRLSERQQ